MLETLCYDHLRKIIRPVYQRYQPLLLLRGQERSEKYSGKRPNSYGGVANLLKTLTKTMEKQGASIETIAKVQYIVCMQAGIYITDEFIEDVAVALTCEEKGVYEE